ncbi:type II toxin-antitoxin system HicA family toxin [Candidatus Woesearchaeota archaeon]|nr:type II toxin-antitoxin system HicA family toxin [Candidatus Woesearchaeota archaeon]
MKLPRLSGREVIKILAKQGFHAARQKGSHIILVKTNFLKNAPQKIPQKARKAGKDSKSPN